MQIVRLGATIVCLLGGCAENSAPVAAPVQAPDRTRFPDDPYRFRADIEGAERAG